MGLILALLIFSLQQSAIAQNKNNIHILTSKDYPSNKLNTKKFTVNKKNKNDVLDVHERDLIFEQCQLTDKITYWDHVDKDILILRSKSLGLDSLLKKYPEIDKKQISCLKSKVKKD